MRSSLRSAEPGGARWGRSPPAPHPRPTTRHACAALVTVRRSTADLGRGTMANDDSNEQDDRNRDDDERDRSHRDDDGDDDANGPKLGGRDLAWKAYLKLAGTILLTLIIFTLILSGWTSCQGKSPVTGQPTPPSAGG